MTTTAHPGKVTKQSTAGKAITSFVAECAEKYGENFERYPKPIEVWETLKPVFRGYCQDNEIKQKNSCRSHYNKMVDSLFELKGWPAPIRSLKKAPLNGHVDLMTREIQGDYSDDSSSLGSFGSSAEEEEEEEEEDCNGGNDDASLVSVTNTISSFSLTGAKMPSKGGAKNSSNKIVIRGVDPDGALHRALLINPDAWTDGNDTYASACLLLPSCYKTHSDITSSRFCATILPNRKEVQIDLRLPSEFTSGNCSSAFFFGQPHHDAASATFLTEISKRRKNNHIQPCQESIVLSLPFEVEPDFCDTPPTGNGCVLIRDADGTSFASRHFLFTVKKRSNRYMPRMQANDFTFNPYHAADDPAAPGSTAGGFGSPGGGIGAFVPTSPAGGFSTPQKRQKNN
jgi:hypothetical protein